MVNPATRQEPIPNAAASIAPAKRSLPRVLFPLLGIVLLGALSIVLRWHEVSVGQLGPRYHIRPFNGDVSHHTQRIVRGYQQAARNGIPQTWMPSEMYFLNEMDTGKIDPLPQGKNALANPFQVDRIGRSVYVSFPPAPFLAMYGILEPFGIDASIGAIRMLGGVLQVLTAFLMTLFIWKATEGLATNAIRGWGAFAGGLVYLISTETWHSGVASVWAHHIAQPAFVGLALVYAFARPGKLRLAALFVMALASSAFEWSGYFLTFWLFLASLSRAVANRKTDAWRAHLSDAAMIAVGTGVALGGMFAHYEWAYGIERWYDTVRLRVQERSVSVDYWSVLVECWYAANGWLIVVGALLPLAVVGLLKKLPTAATLALGGLLFSIVENFILRQHVVHYTFDLFKLICGLGMLFGLSTVVLAARRPRIWGAIVCAGAIGAIVVAADHHQTIYGAFQKPWDETPYAIAETIKATARPDEMIFYTLEFPPDAAQLAPNRKAAKKGKKAANIPAFFEIYSILGTLLDSRVGRVKTMENACGIANSRHWDRVHVYRLRVELVDGQYYGVEVTDHATSERLPNGKWSARNDAQAHWQSLNGERDVQMVEVPGRVIR